MSFPLATGPSPAERSTRCPAMWLAGPSPNALKLLMRDRASTRRIGLTALYRLRDVQVVRHVLHTAAVGQAIEERFHGLLSPHRILLQRQSIASGVRSRPWPRTPVVHANHYSTDRPSTACHAGLHS